MAISHVFSSPIHYIIHRSEPIRLPTTYDFPVYVGIKISLPYPHELAEPRMFQLARLHRFLDRVAADLHIFRRMALTKRGKYWFFDFQKFGKRFQGTTGQTNINKARLVESTLKSDAALARFGIAPRKAAPLLKDFLEGKFLDHIRQHNAGKPRTILVYENGVKALLRYTPFTVLTLDRIDEYTKLRATQHRRKRGGFREGKMTAGGINRELNTLQHALNLAYEWQLITRRPKVHKLPTPPGREFVLSGEFEVEYLAKLDYPLKQVAILMLDCGLRPDEAVSLHKADISDFEVQVRGGKTPNARRVLPISHRVSEAIDLCIALFPHSPWLFPGRKDHLRAQILDNKHAELRKRYGWPKEFVLYSCRHTFGTRLAESGASPYEIKTLMGHYSIVVSQRYVHPSAITTTTAMKRKQAFDEMLRSEAHNATSDVSNVSRQS